MLIIPAVDIKEGKCVRLTQGRIDAVTVYSEDPVEVAKRWAALGAELIHVVDLDGAFEGRSMNFDIIKRMADSIDTPIQVGGGIRSAEAAAPYLGLRKVSRVVLGTVAYERPELLRELTKTFPNRIAVGIDAKAGFVAIKGWQTVTGEKAVHLARMLEDSGVSSIIYTDISRDGMLQGPNVEAAEEVARAVNVPVIASGGISSIKDIEAYRNKNIKGVIIGKALYTGKVNLREAIEAGKGVDRPSGGNFL